MNKVQTYNKEITKLLQDKLVKDNSRHQSWHETLDVGDEEHSDIICLDCTNTLDEELKKRYQNPF